MSGADPASLADQLATIWARFRDATLARVDQLDDAIVALLEDRLTDEMRLEATREAHKLAGSSGTFGFPAASVIARDLERRFKSNAFTQNDVPELSQQVVRLRTELEGTPRAPAGPVAAPTRPAKAFLLLVDDDAATTDRLMMAASGRGFDVVQAVTAREGEKLLRAHRPDAVLIDLRQSGEDTLRLLDAIRSLAPPVPTVVALHEGSLHGRVGVAQRGARRCLDAPASPTLILDAVAAEWQQSIETRGTILAVDDDPQMLAAVGEILRARGLNLVTLNDSSQFWQALEASNPDLVLLAVDMPGINAVEICRIVRGNARWTSLPIVFLTGRSDSTTVNTALSTSAEDFLSKPIDATHLQTRVVDRLEQMRLQREHTEIDAATGIRNRERSTQLIDRFLQLAHRTKEPTAFAVVRMETSTTSPELEGEMLRGLACALAASVRPDEIVGRWDAHEIVIVSYGTQAADLGARLRAPIADFAKHEFRTGGAAGCASARAGIAECPTDGIDCDALARAALGASHVGPDGSGSITYAHVQSSSSAFTTDVVIVDDDDAVAELIAHGVAAHGLKTDRFADGARAAAELTGIHPPTRARLVVLDVDLPGMNGYEVLRLLARDGVIRSTKVIMLTAREAEDEVIAGLEMGALDHVSKPFNLPVLVHKIIAAIPDATA